MTVTKSTVYGFHLDMYGHINNARYLEFLEAARWEFISAKMSLKDLENSGIAFVVVNIHINYRHPATIGHVLEIQTKMSHVSSKSAKVHQEIFIEGSDQIVVDADVTFVIIDAHSHKVLPIKDDLRQLIEKF